MSDEKTSPWPIGCSAPSGCERRRACGYFGCPHQQRDIAPDVDAAVARAKADAAMAGLRTLFGATEDTQDVR